MTEIRDTAGGWPVTGSQVDARGRIVTLRTDSVRMPDGEIAVREVVEHPGAVAIVALDEDDRVLMIRQYRHPAAATLWELPAGLRDVAGEPLVQTARRELIEEAGCRASDWRTLTRRPDLARYQHRTAAHLPCPRSHGGPGSGARVCS